MVSAASILADLEVDMVNYERCVDMAELIPLEEDKKKPGETEMVPIKEENNQLPVGHPSIKK
jgi:hypothetical protein